jgi:serine/threonine protein kinase
VVCDFGDSRVSVAGDERMMTKTGTGNWMSPEMLATLDMKNNEQLPSLTIALDIYSLGVIFWQIVCDLMIL